MTASYTAGTVSVSAGSTTVTGTGTGWLTANIAPGYFGLDSANGNPIPVATVDSDTQLTLVTPWRGTSLSGQAYWLSYDTRDGQQTVNNAQRLAEYIALLRSAFFTAFQGLTPAANTFPYFGAGAVAALGSITQAARSLLGLTAGADLLPYMSSTTGYATTAFNAAARALLAGGVLADGQLPTRLRSIPTRLTASGSLDAITESGWTSVANADVSTVGGPPGAAGGVCITLWYGGTNGCQIYTVISGIVGSTAPKQYIRYRLSGGWQPWALTGTPAVGTVSQLSGVPTGSIIERGSNANGEYVRFADGTQICWCTPQSTDINIAFGSVFRGTLITATFPVSFASAATGAPPPTGFGSMATTTMGWLNTWASSPTQINVTALSGTSRAGDIVRFGAIGRWF